MTDAATAGTRSGDLVDVTDLEVVFRTRRNVVHAVNGVSFSVGRGERIGIVGETGCGKSTLVRAMIRLLPRSAEVLHGTVEFAGRNLLALSDADLREVRASNIAFIPQNAFSSLQPIVDLEAQFRNIVRLNEKLSRAECRKRALEMLGHVRIVNPERVLRGHAHELSGGMAQRVLIAMAMIRRPQLLIADEPTTGLDLPIRRQIMDLICDVREEQGSSLIVVTHDMGVVAQYCERVAVLYAGQIVESGPVVTVFSAPKHPYTEALLESVPRRDQPLAVIKGNVPSMLEAPTACVFASRCRYVADPRCETTVPPLREVEPGHFTRTFCDLPITAARGQGGEEEVQLAAEGVRSE